MGNIFITISPEKIRECLELPLNQGYEEAPEKEDMFAQLDAVMGYKTKISKINEFKRNKLPAFWQVLMEILNKCLSSKIGGTDQINMSVLTIMFSLINGLNIDFGTEIFNLIKRSILTKTGRIDSHLPFPRFLSIIISDAFSERNLEIPKSKIMWKTKIMRPWTVAGSWKSDYDVPVLSEKMMYLIPEDSPYRT
ncbi:hypothetical protein HanHA300_Chr12g0456261 [Helianthus annuus]|nr:hypothetical protein HanHA300_Chr12g0456261 [Helianthus annuus]KAJ0506425.1 hypothetical protein HanHA89_Chr12g0481821 [Helianthus annuus]KAJ0676101.1 hypothetical protein HanLR1_Chr12g0458801 [Helianthus annuus]